MKQGLKAHWHQAICYDEIEYDDHDQGVHVRKCMMQCMICQKELRPEFYYSAIKGPPETITSKANKVLQKHKMKYGNR